MGNLYSHYVFQPPDEPTYEDRSGNMVFLARDANNENQFRICEKPFIYLTTIHGTRIPCIYFEQPSSEFTLVFAHSNGIDLGRAVIEGKTLSDKLKVSVFVFEYTGYGLSNGFENKPSESNLYSDIDAVWKYLVWNKQISPEKIIIVGRSIGSVAAIYCAGRRRVGGIILITPVASAINVALRTCYGGKCIPKMLDMCRNIDRIKFVECPILVIHGSNDDIVPKSHGEILAKLAKFPVKPLWIQGAKHNNILEDFQSVIFERYKTFLHEVLIHSNALEYERTGRKSTIQENNKTHHVSSSPSSPLTQLQSRHSFSSIRMLNPTFESQGRSTTTLRRSISTGSLQQQKFSTAPDTTLSTRHNTFQKAPGRSAIQRDELDTEKEDVNNLDCSNTTYNNVLMTKDMKLGNKVPLRRSFSMPVPSEYSFSRKLDKLEKLKKIFWSSPSDAPQKKIIGLKWNVR